MHKKCLSKYHEIVDSPNYYGQEIHLEGACVSGLYNTLDYEEEDGASGMEPITVFIGSITFPKENAKSHDLYLQSVDCFPSRISVAVRINKLHKIN